MLREKIEPLLLKVQKPSRYIGGEHGSIMKNKEDIDVRFAFCFPDSYDIGMSHLGMKILYSLINSRENYWCERVFAPWTDFEELMVENDIPLYALESLDPVKDFDFIGFTMQYELSYTNLLNMLHLAGVPLYAKDRGESLAPIVIAGGPCVCNPEPLAEFCDIISLGEGEEVTLEMMDLYDKMKKQGATRQEFLREAAKIEGLYIPSLYTVEYNEDGTIGRYVPHDGAPPVIRKRIIKDFDKVFYPDCFVVPFSDIVHNRASVEVLRGCIRGCRFCQAGQLYRPVRERDVNFLKDYAMKMLANTGHEEISLSSLSSSDYSKLPELIDFLIEECNKRKINISLPSLRIDAFSLDVMNKVQDVKKSSLTFAPEAGSQRLRNVINKGLTEEVILQGAKLAFEGGWTRVKLYFMLGLPFETEEDIRGIAELSNKIAALFYETVPKEKRNGKVQIVASTSFFIPKPFTPFQWAPQCRKEEFLEKAYLTRTSISQQLNQKSIKYNWHEADASVMEGIFARGDRRLNQVILKAYEKGCFYDAWSEYYKNDLWFESFEECGIDPDFYTVRERSDDEIFPWDFLDCGVSKAFLLREWHRAQEETVTPNCRMQCQGCGAARFQTGVCYEKRA